MVNGVRIIMRFRKLLYNEFAGLLMILPITLIFVAIGAIYGFQKLGFELPAFLLDPIFQVWLVAMAVVIAGCSHMRQYFLMFFIVGVSAVAVGAYYVLYIL